MCIVGKQGKRHIIPLIFQSNSLYHTRYIQVRNYISIKICYQMINFTRKISLIFELIKAQPTTFTKSTTAIHSRCGFVAFLPSIISNICKCLHL